MLNGLSLFSGIGGIDVALSEWIRPIAYCEIDLYCQGVLLSRISDGRLGLAPIWDDIRTFGRDNLQELAIDIIYGGFPCQDISIAGSGKGLAGERSGLFFEIVRLCSEIKPRFIFLENVPAIVSRGGNDVVRTITKMGYDCRWCVISAASVGALHRRERWFLLAHAKSIGSGRELRNLSNTHETKSESKEQYKNKTEQFNNGSEDVAHATSERLEGKNWKKSTFTEFTRYDIWETEPGLGRMADGIPNRVDRIRALGNAVVPCQAKEAFKILMGLYD